MDLTALATHGYAIVEFRVLRFLNEIQSTLNEDFNCAVGDYHRKDVPQTDHIEFVRRMTQKIENGRAVVNLLRDNIDPLIQLLGPDIQVQAHPHLRVSRPNVESDFVDWHRDSFYGNTPWEINVWFPVFPLGTGSGLRLLPGSHRMPSQNVRDCRDNDSFRTEVKKGSFAHQIGYVYAPKTDDTLAKMKWDDTILLTPNFGQAILFFGSCIHKAQNLSELTRVSIDVRVKNTYAPTKTRPGYYLPLHRGIIDESASEFSGEKLEPIVSIPACK